MPSKVFFVVQGLAATVSFMFLAYIVNARKMRGPLFPPAGECQILFQEKWASGRSMKNAITLIGGARNCLKLTVTPDELWTTVTLFPLLAGVYDLEHRIKKQDILSIREQKGLLQGRTLVVEFRRVDGSSGQLEITPTQFDEFKQALQQGLNVA